MSAGRHRPDRDDEARRAQDEEIDLRYRAYQLEDEDENDSVPYESRAADGWSTETKSDTTWWVKAGIAIVSILIVFSLVAGLAGPFLGSFGSEESDEIEFVEALVVSIIDMRTINVEIDDEVFTVRYIGIEPLPIESPWYDVGALANQQLIADRVVILEADKVDKDEFGRLLRYVYVDRNMVNGLLVRNGIALVGEDRDGLNRHHPSLKAWSDAARSEKLGHWSGTFPQFVNGGVN